MPRTYFVRTFGCQMNEHDSERIAGLLDADGLVSVGSEAAADVVVLNTCCIRENADNKLYGHLGNLKRLKSARPDLQIAVAGCLAQMDGEAVLRRAPYVDVVVGTHNVHRTVELLAAVRETGTPVAEIWDDPVVDGEVQFASALPVRRELAYAAWVTIQVGCDNTCAFCIVPRVRGREISRPFEEIVAEVRGLVDDGVTEVTLLGQNVNSYGRDLARAERAVGSLAHGFTELSDTGAGARTEAPVRIRPRFAELLRAVGSVEGLRRVRYTSPHPKDLRPDTIDAMASVATVCEHLHLPLQSGSDRVLAAMHRGYTAERYLERLAEARQRVEDLAVTTDIIVAFPGETEDDFEHTLEVVAAAEYDSAYTFIYSPRPGTEAAEWRQRFVPADVAAERFARLRVVVEHAGRARHTARVGRIEEIVVEGPSKRDPAMLTGRTRQNKLVHVAPPGTERLRPGTYATARITAAGAHHLQGELVEILSMPRHKTRIPVAVVG